MKCKACIAEEDCLSVSEAFVLGMMVADLQRSARLRTEGSLCDRHGRFPHGPERPSPCTPATTPHGTQYVACNSGTCPSSGRAASSA